MFPGSDPNLGRPDPGIGTEMGPYRLLREIGRGATGVVFHAIGPDGETAAVKILVPPPLLTPEEHDSLVRRFLREARALAAVEHPNVVAVYDSGEVNGLLYLAMELVEGENLRRVLTRGGALSPEEGVAIGLQLCGALDAVHHAGIIHRDVKPENLILLPDGTLKLTDFGVAWMESEATLTRTGGVLGSPAYMSPEQILGKPVDRRSDLFSAAVTLYQLLADRLPFEGGSLMEMAHRVCYGEPGALPPEVPYALSRTVMRGLQKSPAARYPTATEFAEALRSTQRGAAPVAVSLSQASGAGADLTATVTDAHGWCPRHPRRAAIGHCRACNRALCRQCARHERPPYYCFVHAPVTLFGLNTVRLEVFLAAVAFLLLLLCLGPLGYAVFSR